MGTWLPPTCRSFIWEWELQGTVYANVIQSGSDATGFCYSGENEQSICDWGTRGTSYEDGKNFRVSINRPYEIDVVDTSFLTLFAAIMIRYKKRPSIRHTCPMLSSVRQVLLVFLQTLH